MSQQKSHSNPRPRRTSVTFEEQKVWITFYRRVGDPSVATELLQHFDSDPDMKRAHPALYLRCKESIRRNKERQVRAKRIGHFVRMFVNTVLISPLMGIRRLLRTGGNIAVECLPEARREPAVHRVNSLSSKSEFAAKRQDFAGQNSAERAGPSGLDDGKGESRNAKAA